MKIHRAGDELFHADGRTTGPAVRHDERNCRFSQFYERV